MKMFFKRLFAFEKVRRAACWIVAQYIRLVWLTGRWNVVAGDIPAGYWDRGQPFLLAFWHGRILMMPRCWRPQKPIHMLTSQHRDGRLIADTVAHFGIQTVAGSTTRGGGSALREMVRKVKAGEWIGITPDGPRGPRMRASVGVVAMARLAGAPVLPVTYSAAWSIALGSWDRFLLPLPFTRGVIIWGRPVEVSAETSDAGMEALREEVEERLNAITIAADMRMKRVPVEPADKPVAEDAAP